MDMTRPHARISSEQGFTLVYMAIFITVLLLFTGMAVDSGRAYVIKAQLTKAVDGAALGAARNLNSGDPRGEAQRIFLANFPNGYLGTSSVTDPFTDPNFFDLTTDVTTGVNVVTVKATAVLPTTFMRLANFNTVTVTSEGEARRRMVDLSLMIDVSSSIGGQWPAVRDAVSQFINAFDPLNDRLSLGTYGWGTQIIDPMPSTRGFNKTLMLSHVPTTLPGGVTPMAEGLYRAWDEVRSVPNGQQSGLRVIVLFTDGSGNTVPGLWDASGVSKGLFTSDFPDVNDPGNITTNTPSIQGLYQTQTGTRSPSIQQSTTWWTSTQTATGAPYMVANSYHSFHRSSGIPVMFPLQSNTLTVNGVTQSTRRGLINYNTTAMAYPAEVRNIRNAATNLVEIIANAARSDADGDYPIRIFTIGMGDLVQAPLGTIPETSESVLIRIANDKRAVPDFNSAQQEGKYYFARTAADVGPAFQALQSQILRLSK
jgi:Flp pilus assembly protein TadG